MKRLCIGIAGIALSHSLWAAQALSIFTSMPLVTTKTPTLFAYNKDLKQLEEIDLQNNENYQLVLPDYAIAFDHGQYASSKKEQAFVIAKDGIYLATKDKAILLVKTASLYGQMELTKFSQLDFIIDVNQDGLSDFLVPELGSSSLYVQTPDGEFIQYAYLTQPDFEGKISQGTLDVSFSYNVNPISTDLNGDGKPDLLFFNDKKVQALYSNKAGFNNTLKTLSLPVELGTLLDGSTRKINQIKDINNDGHVDLITRLMPAGDGFDMMDAEVTNKLYLGNPKGGFASQAIALPSSTPIGQLKFEYDFDGDGKLEMQKFHIDFGLGAIASIALSGGNTDVDVEVGFYKQQNDGNFSQSPLSEKEVEMAVDMNDDNNALSLYVGDINGDTKDDAIFKSGSKTLSVYYGDSTQLLSNKRIKIKHKLPKNGNDILLVDVNQDGKQDFVFKFTDDKGKSSIETLLN